MRLRSIRLLAPALLLAACHSEPPIVLNPVAPEPVRRTARTTHPARPPAQTACAGPTHEHAAPLTQAQKDALFRQFASEQENEPVPETVAQTVAEASPHSVRPNCHPTGS